MTIKKYELDETEIMPYLDDSGSKEYKAKVRADLAALNIRYKANFSNSDDEAQKQEFDEEAQKQEFENLDSEFEEIEGEAECLKKKNIKDTEELLNNSGVSDLHLIVHYDEEDEIWQKEMAIDAAEEFCLFSKENAQEWFKLEAQLKAMLWAKPAEYDADTGIEATMEEIKRIEARVRTMKKYLKSYHSA